MARLSELTRKASAKKAVFLDLDNTLYAYEPCHQAGLKAAFQYYRLKAGPLSWKAFLNAYHAGRQVIHKRLAGQAASHSRLLYFQTLLEVRLGKTNHGFALGLEAAYWNAFLKRMKLAGWVLPFLRYCREQGKKVLLVTNLTTAIQLRKIQKLGLRRWIDFLVTSEEAGVEKPHPSIFKLALRKATCSSRDALVVGDDPASDQVSSLDFFRI